MLGERAVLVRSSTPGPSGRVARVFQPSHYNFSIMTAPLRDAWQWWGVTLRRLLDNVRGPPMSSTSVRLWCLELVEFFGGAFQCSAWTCAICSFTGSVRYSEADNLVRLGRWFAAGELVDVLHSFNDFAPDRVLLAQLFATGVVETDEELAIGGIGIN